MHALWSLSWVAIALVSTTARAQEEGPAPEADIADADAERDGVEEPGDAPSAVTDDPANDPIAAPTDVPAPSSEAAVDEAPSPTDDASAPEDDLPGVSVSFIALSGGETPVDPAPPTTTTGVP